MKDKTPDRTKTFKTIGRRIRLIGNRRGPALKALYREAASLIEKSSGRKS